MELNDIVTVKNKESDYFGCQGQVVRLLSGDKVGVKLGPKDEHMYNLGDEKNKMVVLKAEELRKNKDWCLENRVRFLFSDRWHTIFKFKKKFTAKDDCMCEGCAEKGKNESLVNVCGAIYPYWTCDEDHKKWHGRSVESFPISAKYI